MLRASGRYHSRVLPPSSTPDGTDHFVEELAHGDLDRRTSLADPEKLMAVNVIPMGRAGANDYLEPRAQGARMVRSSHACDSSRGHPFGWSRCGSGSGPA